MVETDTALEFWPVMVENNPKLAEFDSESFDGGAARFMRLMSVVTFDSQQEVGRPHTHGGTARPPSL